MASLITRTPWTKQPQFWAHVDKGNPLTQGLVFAPQLALRGRDVQSPDRALVLQTNTKFEPRDTWMGLRSGPSNNPQGLSIGTTGLSSVLPVGSDLTIAVGVVPQSTGVRELFFSDISSAGAGQSFWMEAQVANTYKVRTDGGSSAEAVGGVVTAGKLTHVALADNRLTTSLLELFVDGKFITSTANGGGSRVAGTTLRLGAPGGYSGGSALYFHGLIQYAYIWNRALSAVELAEIADNPWQVYTPLARKLHFGSAVVSGTAALTGSTSTATAGAVTASLSLGLTGAAATATAGAVAPALGTALAGSSATATPGNVSAGIDIALTGNSATATAGALAVTGDVALAGSTATASAGALSAGITLALSGNTATATAGDLSVPGVIVVSGATVTASAGQVAPGITVGLTGNTATVTAGTLSPAIALALAGLSGTSSAGIVVPGLSLPLTGSTATATAGAVALATGDVTAALTGSIATATAGGLTSAVSLPPLGALTGSTRKTGPTRPTPTGITRSNKQTATR